ncbi:hypothetical protein SOD_c36130 [Serratia plymuthica 4Rx13]|uniref:Uncharacterized protein n=2 Tax=Serratia plymuthica TaxID=82996 RepID=A0A318P2M3_SERPL|nr:hypothetical protein SOD_c36130 [Serratia plymuthica 4Rx13]PYD36423.1 hypothetical protein CT690_24105 [Serratia plymuthica]
MQLDYELKKDKRKILYEKGEELIYLYIKWAKYVSMFQTQNIQLLKGDLTESVALKVRSETSENIDHDRVLALIHAYFPEIKVQFDVADKYRSEAVMAYFAFKAGSKSKSDTLDAIHENADLFDREVKVFNEKLSEILKVNN